MLAAPAIDMKRTQESFAYITFVSADLALGQQILTGKELPDTERGSDIVFFFFVEAYPAVDVLEYSPEVDVCTWCFCHYPFDMVFCKFNFARDCPDLWGNKKGWKQFHPIVSVIYNVCSAPEFDREDKR
jgi:hypothetical protein